MFRWIGKIVAITAAMAASPLMAQVSADFTTGAIAEYTGSNANRNDNTKSFATLGIRKITMSQSGTSWGGTQGNDLSVTLTITFTDNTTYTTPSAVLNWQKNASGGAVDYFGVTTSTVAPDANDRYVRSSELLKKTYILVLPSRVTSSGFSSLVTSDATDGSANFSPAEVFAALQADFPAAQPPAANASPIFTSTNAGSGTSYSFDYDENSPSGAVVGTVNASDPENATLTYSITAGNDAGWYAINSSTGAITLTTAGAASLSNNFEVTPNSQMLTVEVSDGVNRTTVQVALNETNVNDGGPVFTGTNATGAGNAPAYSFDYAENAAVGATLGTVAATDPDGTAVTFNITNGNGNDWFSINSTTGAITLTTAGAASVANDFEKSPNLQTLTVSASDGVAATLIEVRMNETNLDDTPPAITGPNGISGSAVDAISVNEGQTSVTRLVASEAVTWSITSGNDRGKFQIAADGTITFLDAPDFETPTDTDTNNTYVLTVTATDAAGNVTTQTIRVTVLNIDDTAPVITGPNGGPGAAASALTIPESSTAVTRFTANEAVTWSIDSGADAAKFRIDAATGTIVFVAAPDFENPTDSDRNNTYVVRIKAVDAAGNVSFQTLTVTITNVDEIARKLGQIGDKLRGSLRNYAARGLSDMLAFNESFMASNDNFCADPKNQNALSGSARANENGANLDVKYAQRLSECSRPHQLFVDAGISTSRAGGDWNSRIFGALRLETKFNDAVTLGLAVLASSSSDKLVGFESSSISDKSLQLNAYGRYNVSDTLRTGAFIGFGHTSYDFALTEGDGFDLNGSMTGKRQIYGWMLSGDFNLGSTVITTDAIISHAREKLGSAILAARYLGENRSGIAFALGKVDITRISVPVTAPISLSGSPDYGSWSRLLLSPGLLCEDNDVQSSGLRCGYQLGAKFVANDGGRGSFYADYNWESVAGMRRSLIGVGYAYRIGEKNNLALAVEANRGLTAMAGQDNRAMLSIRVAQ